MLFVCLGNICRSPMAEGALRAAALHRGLDCHVDSAGTASYHIGSRPDDRAIAVARANGVEIASHAARQIEHEDFYRFSHIVALDRANLEGIKARAPRDGTARVSLLLDATEGGLGQSVVDPYHGSLDDFATAWMTIAAGIEALVDQLLGEGYSATG